MVYFQKESIKNLLMHPVEKENDPRILKGLVVMMDAEIQRLQQMIIKINLEKAKSDQAAFKFEESLRILRRNFFGKSSEKSISDRRKSLKEDNEVLLHAQNLLPPMSKNSTKKLAEETIVHEMSVEELKAASLELGLENPSSDQWEKVNHFFEESTEIEIIERSYKKIRHQRQKYKLKTEFNHSEKESVIITADGNEKLLPGSSYSIDFAVSTVIDKHLNHIPLERQVRMMESLGLKNMSTNTLYNLSNVVAIYLEPIAERIKNEILSLKLIHSDETPWPINNNKDSDGYMWIISNQKGSHYKFEPTRSGQVIRETLGNYQGCVVSDGYSGYTQFKKEGSNIKSALCHAHARRYFWDILETYPDCKEYIELYKTLFEVEHKAKTFEELKILRKTESKLIIQNMFTWLNKMLLEARSETTLLKAINYSLNNWKELSLFLEDENIPLTNNEAERTIRHAVMGRKNFYGSRSINGADVTAIIYTIIESCKKVELDPREYLLKTIRSAAKKAEKQLTPFETAEALLSQPPG
jgi:transposase